MGLRYEFPQQESLNYFVIQEEHTVVPSTGKGTGTVSNVGVPAPSSKAKDFNQEDVQDETFTH